MLTYLLLKRDIFFYWIDYKVAKMIRGIGIDIIEVARIEANIHKYGQKFLDKVFTEEEQKYCQSFRQSSKNFAGRFAAKEAVVKALGTGLTGGLSWTDLAILNNEQGKPYLALTDTFKKHFKNPLIHISISHCQEYATATAIWEE